MPTVVHCQRQRRQRRHRHADNIERLQFLDRLIELQAPTDALSDETTINNSAADVWDPIKRDHDAVSMRKLQDISSLLPADWDVV